MAYNPNAPADDQTLAAFPPEMREQLRAIINDQVVNALKLCGLSPGNAAGTIPVSNGNLNVNLNADKLDGKEAADFAPVGWIPPIATGSSNGSMSNTDKAKLDGMQTGAEVNQMAFSNILVGGTTIQADAKTDTLELVAGTNIALAPDATNDRVTIGVTGTVASAMNATNHINATSGAHAATAISVTSKGNISSTTVQSALEELDTEKVNAADVVITATAGKILKLDSSGNLPTNITGNSTSAYYSD